MNQVIFKEEQKIKRIWLWILAFIGFGSAAGIGFLQLGAYFDMVENVGSTDKAMQLVSGILLALIGIGFLYIFTAIRLQTEVRKDGFYWRFPPFLRKWRNIDPKEVKYLYIRQYRPIAEYGGWGYRFGFSGKAYNMRGNIGLQFVLDTNKKVLFGTQKPDELEKALKKIMQRKVKERKSKYEKVS